MGKVGVCTSLTPPPRRLCREGGWGGWLWCGRWALADQGHPRLVEWWVGVVPTGGYSECAWGWVGRRGSRVEPRGQQGGHAPSSTHPPVQRAITPTTTGTHPPAPTHAPAQGATQQTLYVCTCMFVQAPTRVARHHVQGLVVLLRRSFEGLHKGEDEETGGWGGSYVQDRVALSSGSSVAPAKATRKEHTRGGGRQLHPGSRSRQHSTATTTARTFFRRGTFQNRSSTLISVPWLAAEGRGPPASRTPADQGRAAQPVSHVPDC